MSAFALTGATILVGTGWTGTAPGGSATASGTISSTTDISAMVTQIELSLSAEELEITNFASAGWRQKISGLQEGTVALTFNDSYAASNADALFGLGGTFGLGVAPIYFDIKATSSSRGSTNPSYVMRVLNLGGSIMSGAVGSVAVKSFTFPTTGLVQRLAS
jgi:hypothetical protein